MVAIRRYTDADAQGLLALLQSEGEAWGDYHRDGMKKYAAALRTSIVYVLDEGGVLCGFVRARDDGGFGVYVYDLLVHAGARGKGYGRALLEQVKRDFPGGAVYVMSDVDGYYEKIGGGRVGSVFTV